LIIFAGQNALAINKLFIGERLIQFTDACENFERLGRQKFPTQPPLGSEGQKPWLREMRKLLGNGGDKGTLPVPPQLIECTCCEVKGRECWELAYGFLVIEKLICFSFSYASPLGVWNKVDKHMWTKTSPVCLQCSRAIITSSLEMTDDGRVFLKQGLPFSFSSHYMRGNHHLGRTAYWYAEESCRRIMKLYAANESSLSEEETAERCIFIENLKASPYDGIVARVLRHAASQYLDRLAPA